MATSRDSDCIRQAAAQMKQAAKDAVQVSRDLKVVQFATKAARIEQAAKA